MTKLIWLELIITISNMEEDNEELKRRLDRDEQYIEKVVTQLDLLVNIVGTMLKRW